MSLRCLAAAFGLVVALSLAHGLGLWELSSTQASPGMYSPPDAKHWLGTNRLGQDVLARIIESVVNSVLLGVPVGLAACGLGGALGIAGGFWAKSWLDGLINTLIGTGEALPAYLLAAVVAAATGGSVLWVGLALAAGLAASTARVVRERVEQVRSSEHIATARSLGVPAWRIVALHLPPHVVSLLIIQGFLCAVAAIKTDAVLGFLGLADADRVGFGVLLAESASAIVGGHYLMPITSCASFFVLVWTMNVLADVAAERYADRARVHGA